MVFNLGLKAIRRAVEEQKPLEWHKNKLTESLFSGGEVEVFKWVQAHLAKFHQLPQLDTLVSQFPEIKELDSPEPMAYYLHLVQNRYAYNRINTANLDSQLILKANKDDIPKALANLEKAVSDIKSQQYRTKIMDVSQDAPKLVLTQYHQALQHEAKAEFGWPYLDEMTGGGMPGDVISYVGRPAMGKTWKVLFGALHNWRRGSNIVVASMEMNILAVAQRVASMYAGTNIGQLKMGAYSSQTYNKFAGGLVEMAQEKGKLYVIDGNLAASAEDIYLLAAQLGADAVYIDGAYLMKHSNTRLDRFTRVAENVDLMKQFSTQLELPTFASWQLNRDAAKNSKKTGQKAGLEDIGYSDAIGQISSIVLGLMQEEGVETMNQRMIDVMKGRNGEIGQFAINWLFNTMNFTQAGLENGQEVQPGQLNYI